MILHLYFFHTQFTKIVVALECHRKESNDTVTFILMNILGKLITFYARNHRVDL